MPLQTTYTERQRVGVPGMVNRQVPYSVVSRALETAAGAVSAIAISQGTTDQGCVIGGTVAGFLGISMRDPTIYNATAPDTYKQRDEVAILTRGEIFVTAPAAIAVGDPVYFVPATGVLTNVATANNLITGARWKHATTNVGDLNVVQLGIQR